MSIYLTDYKNLNVLKILKKYHILSLEVKVRCAFWRCNYFNGTDTLAFPATERMS